MTRIRTLALALVLACAGISNAEAETKPFETVRELQALQDRMATGDVIAAASHARALERTALIFSRAGTSVWAEPRNARALVIFLFSGGNAGIVAEAVPSTAVAAEMRALFEGAVAYGLGDDDKARTLLMPIDARSLPNGLGGRLALVQAILCSEPDKPKAIALLDVARLLEPGTLVEEAALRKELSLIGAAGDLDKFGLLSRRYAGAFGRSIYAENYHQLLVATATRVGSHDGKDAVVTLGRVMQSIDRGERRTVYLAIAHEAVLAGRTMMAAYAAREAARLPGGSASDATRAMVYLGAATIFGDGYGDGRKSLADAAPARLDARDRLLRESALAVAEMIRREPAAAPTAAGRTTEVAIVDEGERAIARADETLGKATR